MEHYTSGQYAVKTLLDIKRACCVRSRNTACSFIIFLEKPRSALKRYADDVDLRIR